MDMLTILWLYCWLYYSMLVMITISCICLAMEGPTIDTESDFGQFIYYTDIIFGFIFTIEMGLKIFVMGLCGPSDAYLSDSWNILDASVVVCYWLGFSMSSSTSSSGTNSAAILRLWRMLRVLSPVRVITRHKGMRTVVYTIFKTIPALINVVIIMAVVYLIFGILGVQLFGGALYSCSLDLSLSNNTESACIYFGGTWNNQPNNFDNIFQAFLTLFQISTMDNWGNLMWTCTDSVGPGYGPEKNSQPWAALYFVAFIIITAFFLNGVFVGSVYGNHIIVIRSLSFSFFLLTSMWYGNVWI
jgi:voltage-dependent calcium channel T type alpha-1G